MGMPTPGTDGWEKAVEMMKEDLIDWRHTKVEMAARKLLKEQGRDFDTQFEKWKENKTKNAI